MSHKEYSLLELEEAFCPIHTSSVIWSSTNPGAAMKGICRYRPRPHLVDQKVACSEWAWLKQLETFQQGLAFPE